MPHHQPSESSFKSLRQMPKWSTALWMVMTLKGQVLAVTELRKTAAKALASSAHWFIEKLQMKIKLHIRISSEWNISAVPFARIDTCFNGWSAPLWNARSGFLRDQTEANSDLLSVGHAEHPELQIYILGICFPCQGSTYCYRLSYTELWFQISHSCVWLRRLWKHQRNLFTCGGLRTPRTAMPLSLDSFSHLWWSVHNDLHII